MPKLKRKKAYAEESVTAFSGLSDGTAACVHGSTRIRNFSFSPDGKLEKRHGYSLEREFDAPIRATWQSVRTSFSGRFYLAGNEIFYEDGNGGYFSFGQVQNSSGRANFFVYRGYLYLADSSCIYFCNFTERSFLPVYGYVPLVGDQWDPVTGTGSLNEPLNLLSPRIRVSYNCTFSTSEIRLPYPALSVDAVLSNGQAIPYSFTPGGRTLYLVNTVSGSTVEVAMTLEDFYAPLREAILSCNISYGYEKEDLECLYLTGGIDRARAFSAAKVDSAMLAACKRLYQTCDPLYFKASGSLLLGDQDHPLTAFVRHNNRIIAFGTAGAWSLKQGETGDTLESYFLDCCPGCVASEGAIAVGEELLVLTPAGLCSLKADSVDKDHFAVKPLSSELAKTLSGMDLSQTMLFFDPSKNRILLRDAGENQFGLLYLYDRTLGVWTAWDHIRASRFFSVDRGILFSSAKKLFRFDESVYSDNGAEYTAYYQSSALSFGSPEEYKRALRLFCEASARDEELMIEVWTETGGAAESWECVYRSFPTLYEFRVPTYRFRNFSYRISFVGSGQATIHRVGYCCNL